MFKAEDFIVDELFGERLLISKQADPSELGENIRVARVLLDCFDDMKIRINEHLLVFGHKNPEYTINDFDMHMADSVLKTKKIASGIYGRHVDFTSGNINECYVVHNSRAVVVKPNVFVATDKDTVKQLIEEEVEKLRTQP